MRQELTRETRIKDFREYYWLKTELVSFCRENGIASTGKKSEIAERIEEYLETGKVEAGSRRTRRKTQKETEISMESIIPEEYINDERHRKFFKEQIGERFKFNVIFMNWMKENSGRKYKEAVNEWLRIEQEKKAGKKYDIGAQFEYNQYTRDFFAANPGKTRKEAIICWKHKKSKRGKNKYEDSDIEILEDR